MVRKRKMVFKFGVFLNLHVHFDTKIRNCIV